jgi:hypothetical protein
MSPGILLETLTLAERDQRSSRKGFNHGSRSTARIPRIRKLRHQQGERSGRLTNEATAPPVYGRLGRLRHRRTRYGARGGVRSLCECVAARSCRYANSARAAAGSAQAPAGGVRRLPQSGRRRSVHRRVSRPKNLRSLPESAGRRTRLALHACRAAAGRSPEVIRVSAASVSQRGEHGVT